MPSAARARNPADGTLGPLWAPILAGSPLEAPDGDYFADGVTENLTTDLSRIRNSFVIARNTAFTFKGKNVDAKEIGKELGVRYVLEGSVQRAGARVRVNAQLVDAESGAHLWADRFEEDVADLFKLQDQVVARLANSLGNELAKAETAKSARSKDPDAIDLTLRGEALLREAWNNKDTNDAARALFELALKIDPNESEALAGEADTYILESKFWRNPETAYDGRIIGQVDRAIALAPDSVRPYGTKSWYLFEAHRWDEAIRAADAGLAINPNSAPSVWAASIRCKWPRPLRASQIRCATGDAAQSPRSGNRLVACVFGQCGTWPRALRRRDRGIP